MSERLRSVGLDVGTTTTQMILSELTVENRASSFAVPELEISGRRILYRSPVRFTPMLDACRVDAAGLKAIVEEEYRKAGLTRETVDTGAVIITGETSRKENARTVLDGLSDLAGDFVVAAAGPDLESILAARGAGAVEYSRKTGKTLIHMDIGGGTANLCRIREGKILGTTCLNVGGRLITYDESARVTYVSPVLTGLGAPEPGDRVSARTLEPVARLLVQGLEMAVGLRPAGELLARLTAAEAAGDWEIPEPGAVISFSGGVADCVEGRQLWDAFGDMGVVLGRAIRESGLCAGAYRLGAETIRATVIGAGCHSTQLSGSTVFSQNVPFPLKNIPVVSCRPDRQAIRQSRREREGAVMLALSCPEQPGYRHAAEMARELLADAGEGPLLICLEQDMAKALGQLLALALGPEAAILCIDRVRVREDSYLDIGRPVGPAIPVVVKTLVFGA